MTQQCRLDGGRHGTYTDVLHVYRTDQTMAYAPGDLYIIPRYLPLTLLTCTYTRRATDGPYLHGIWHQ